jgi:peptide/nickel transport system permease protein
VIYGSRTALRIGLPAVVIGFVPGLLIGLFAGYIGGIADAIAIVVLDAILSLPAVIFALVAITLFGNSVNVITLIIAVAFIPGYGRLARAQTLAVKENLYIKAERSLGAPSSRIIFRHILPNIIPPLLVLMAMDVPGAIGAEAGLAFLGIGVQPPTADWGVSLNQGFQYVRTQPWGLVGPLVALLLVTGAFVVLGETLRDVLDPRLAGTGIGRRLRLRAGVQRL